MQGLPQADLQSWRQTVHEDALALPTLNPQFHVQLGFIEGS